MRRQAFEMRDHSRKDERLRAVHSQNSKQALWFRTPQTVRVVALRSAPKRLAMNVVAQ